MLPVGFLDSNFLTIFMLHPCPLSRACYKQTGKILCQAAGYTSSEKSGNVMTAFVELQFNYWPMI